MTKTCETRIWLDLEVGENDVKGGWREADGAAGRMRGNPSTPSSHPSVPAPEARLKPRSREVGLSSRQGDRQCRTARKSLDLTPEHGEDRVP